MKKLFAVGTMIFIALACYSQGEIDNQKKVFYRNEESIAFLLNSNGWGFNLRYGKRIDGYRKKLFEIDIIGIKHPKEVKQSNSLNPSTRSFVYGKSNACFDIRLSYGLQKEIFSKQDKGGIAIRYFYNYGPSLALMKPIYYTVIYQPYSSNYYFRTEKFSNNITTLGDVYGKESFFKGINETFLIPGGFFKFGFNFEYSKQDIVIHAIEVGVVVEAFAKKLPIMFTEKNNQFFISPFVSYRLGRIVDPLARKQKAESAKNEW
jgi:hypothetical protein